jgi:hypothetical protein
MDGMLSPDFFKDAFIETFGQIDFWIQQCGSYFAFFLLLKFVIEIGCTICRAFEIKHLSKGGVHFGMAVFSAIFNIFYITAVTNMFKDELEDHYDNNNNNGMHNKQIEIGPIVPPIQATHTTTESTIATAPRLPPRESRYSSTYSSRELERIGQELVLSKYPGIIPGDNGIDTRMIDNIKPKVRKFYPSIPTAAASNPDVHRLTDKYLNSTSEDNIIDSPIYTEMRNERNNKTNINGLSNDV